VISIGAQTPIRFELTNWRLRHLQIPTNPATAPQRRRQNDQTVKNRFRDRRGAGPWFGIIARLAM
jgi:hypothetical protein